MDLTLERQLIDAIQADNVQLATLLIHAGADCNNARWTDGATILMWAIEKGAGRTDRVDFVRLVLSRVTVQNINIQNKESLSALCLAVRKNDVGLVKELLAAGASMYLEYIQKLSNILHIAVIACKNNTTMLKLLLENVPILNREWLLLQAMADDPIPVQIDILNGHSCVSPLISACNTGNYDAAQLLLLQGAQVNLQTIEGKTALMVACEKWNVSICTLLLEHGAHVNLRDKDGKTALESLLESSGNGHIAGVTKDVEPAVYNIVRLLVHAGAEFDQGLAIRFPILTILKQQAIIADLRTNFIKSKKLAAAYALQIKLLPDGPLIKDQAIVFAECARKQGRELAAIMTD